MSKTGGDVLMRVDVDTARALAVDILEAAGAPSDRALLQARWLLEGDLRGHPSHGLQRLPVLAGRMRARLVVADADPRVEWRTRAVAVIDGRRGFGPWVGVAAIDAAGERAREQGVALAAVRNANHLGLLSPYVERAAERGQLALALTTSEALVHPWGGREALIGTNPIAVGIPARPGPFVLDMATGAVSMGKVLSHAHRGEPLEPGWALDRQGRATSNARDVGAISPFGGAKGYALGLALELLVALPTATALGPNVTGTLDAETPCTKGDLFLCIDPERLGAGDVVARATAYVDLVRASAPAAGQTRVSVPGDRARAARTAALQNGIELPREVWDRLLALRDELAEAVPDA